MKGAGDPRGEGWGARGEGTRRSRGARGARTVPFVLALVGLLLVVAAVRADNWRPYEATRFTDASGRFVVAVEPTANGVELSPGRTGPRGRYGFLEIVDGAEVLRGHGTLDELPLDVRIAPHGGGFAALRAWAGDGRGRCIVLADERGVVRRALTLAEVWTPQDIDGMERSSSSLTWMRGAWWTNDGAALVLLPFPGGGQAAPMVIPVDPRKSLWPLGDVEVLAALGGAEGTDPDLALDLVAERHIAAAGAQVRAIAADPTCAPSRRVRAWVAAAALGQADGIAQILRIVRLPAPDDDAKAVRDLALSRLELAVGRGALGILAALRAGAGSDAALASESLWRIAVLRGADPGDVVRRMEDARGRDDALTLALARMAASLREVEASRIVLLAAANASANAVDAAVTAFWMARRPDASGILAGALRAHPRETEALVEWFEQHRHPPVVAALVDELERRVPRREEKVLAALAHALEVQTGERYGTDVAAWRRWMAGAPK